MARNCPKMKAFFRNYIGVILGNYWGTSQDIDFIGK